MLMRQKPPLDRLLALNASGVHDLMGGFCYRVKIIAVLCSLSSPANCYEQMVTTSDSADVSMQSCLMGAPQ
jgi:hypothetical protein